MTEPKNVSDQGKISISELRRLFEMCVENTTTLKPTKDAHTGFVIGFRLYERIATRLGRQVTEDESQRAAVQRLVPKVSFRL